MTDEQATSFDAMDATLAESIRAIEADDNPELKEVYSWLGSHMATMSPDVLAAWAECRARIDAPPKPHNRTAVIVDPYRPGRRKARRRAARNY